MSLTPAGDAKLLLPDGWASPRGYSHGVSVSGRIVTVAGQIGWNPETAKFESDDFVDQVRQALKNVVAVLGEANASPSRLVRLTWFITEREEYIVSRREIGAVYREVIGNHYPPMSIVIVSGLIEERAKVEIEATAVIPE
ncbi:MAG TPA: RidA family protein [Gemmatimonadaceae bacterium]|nr:RidA family protein [Gemmatimonadaceae bacterium]